MSKNILGHHRSDGSDREPDDFYATHPSAIPPLLELLGWTDGGKVIRENSCGMGHLSEVLSIYGHRVISTDLVDRGYGIGGVDFLQDHWIDQIPVDAIIMDPPYKYTLEFIIKSLKLAPIVCAFLRITLLETPDRAKFFKTSGLKFVAVFSKRCPSSKNAKFIKDDGKKESGAVCYAWFIWERGYKGEPVIKWI